MSKFKEFTSEEGGRWIGLNADRCTIPDYVLQDIVQEQIAKSSGIVYFTTLGEYVHALRTEDGQEWDVSNGWRQPVGEILVQQPTPENVPTTNESTGGDPADRTPLPYMPDHEKWFIIGFTSIMSLVHNEAVYKGFWDDRITSGTKYMLMVTELAEGFESVRDGTGTLPDDHCPSFNREVIELADTVIRIMDYAGQHDLPLAEAIISKYRYNVTRPRMHGKLF